MPARLLSIISLATGVLVEVLQCLKLADKLGFERGGFVHQFLGNTCSWHDLCVCMCMYLIGALLTYWLVSWIQRPVNHYAKGIEN